MGIEKFGVIGSGQMGNGIAQVAAASGLNVVMSDIKKEFCEKGLANIAKNLDRMISKGKLDEDEKVSILGRIQITTDLSDMTSVDFVVEAAVEQEDLKFKIFEDLDKICKPHVILSTNTSSIPIGRIAARTSRPDKVIGMHFMNPVPVMKLVEVIQGLATSKENFDLNWELC
jgi:3-hydroxybutyryl-CoA dehydrogenase